MKKFLKKFNAILLLSAAAAGVFCLCGFSRRLPANISVNGVEIGGMTRSAAVAAVRGKIEEELKQKSLKIRGAKGEYIFTFPEIYYKDDVGGIVGHAVRGGVYTAHVEYYLCGINEIAEGICLDESVEAVEPRAEFSASGEPFSYSAGKDGKIADPVLLKEDILRSLGGDFCEVNVSFREVKRKVSLDEVKSRTSLLASFSTAYDPYNANRSSNIALAASLLNGATVGGGETLSFNATVGARLPERGFLPAKIIENGEYSEGCGGGVCQVSTTLYNAALLSGMAITEYHPHSLPVGYVAPSRDAMVSGSECDLKFKNPSAYPVYIRAEAAGGVVNFKIYGKSDGARYFVESKVVGSLPAPEESCSDPLLAKSGKDGILSEGYLVIDRGGYIKRVRLRSDKYLPQKRVIYVGEDGGDGF